MGVFIGQGGRGRCFSKTTCTVKYLVCKLLTRADSIKGPFKFWLFCYFPDFLVCFVFSKCLFIIHSHYLSSKQKLFLKKGLFKNQLTAYVGLSGGSYFTLLYVNFHLTIVCTKRKQYKEVIWYLRSFVLFSKDGSYFWVSLMGRLELSKYKLHRTLKLILIFNRRFCFLSFFLSHFPGFLFSVLNFQVFIPPITVRSSKTRRFHQSSHFTFKHGVPGLFGNTDDLVVFLQVGTHGQLCILPIKLRMHENDKARYIYIYKEAY